MATGSCTATAAPSSARRQHTSRLAESRTSSLPGLNATPSTPARQPASEPPTASLARSTARDRQRMLMASTSPRITANDLTPSSSAAAPKARTSFGRQPPAVAEARGQEAPADPPITRQRLGNPHYVGACSLADLGHAVDEGQLGGQEGVGRHFNQLGCFQAHDQPRGTLGERLSVNVPQELSRPVRRDAEDNALR